MQQTVAHFIDGRRGIYGKGKYTECIKEVYRVLKPGGIFGLGEPVHLDTEIPDKIRNFVTQGEVSFEKCFATIDKTEKAVKQGGFKIIEAGIAEDATS